MPEHGNTSQTLSAFTPREIEMKRIVCIAAALFVATASLPASAQQQRCGKRPDIVSHLAKNFSESPVAIALSGDGVIEVLTSKNGASWTIIFTTPDGNTCLMAAGESWEPVTTVAKLGPGV